MGMTTRHVMNTIASSRPQSLRSAAYVWVAPRWVLALLSTFLGPLAGLLRRSRQELWDGGDHLLVVEHTGYRERYRRIRYDAIQAWTARSTADYLATSLVLGAVITLLLGIAWTGRTDEGMGTWFWPLAAGGYTLVLLIHLALGPTVRVHLHTAVQTLEIPAAGRRRTWQRVRRHLIDRITTAQGIWKTDDWLSRTAPPSS
jgi:hypothetical protein